MSLKEFENNFGIEATIEQEKLRFINRIENRIFEEFLPYNYYDKNLFNQVCYEMGEDANVYFRNDRFPPFSAVTKKDFNKTLLVVTVLADIFNKDEQYHLVDNISDEVTSAISKARCDLGIKWVNGSFYPSGDQILDTQLIESSFLLLDQYPNEKIDFKNALDNYQAGSLYGVVENCYLAIEGLCRKVLNNNETLDKNRVDLKNIISSSNEWGAILSNYIRYAHEYRRHASENRHNLKPEEVEAYLYLTGLIIRVVIKKVST